MTPEQLSRVREIYEQALLLSRSALDAFLERECQGNQEIRAEVERLLNARRRIPGWLDQPAAAAARLLADPEPPRMEGRKLSGYTLLREIGRGGMGQVYLAERSDGAFRKQVAVKLVLPSAANAGVIARFQQEREILASLDHPNIAKLLDGGVTGEGWPYFVMELVEGQPINRWCDERKLNISQRIELFRSVLAAVRYAHQRLVVHRDLKPGNIFVTNDGVVKLLDFGIAKVVSSRKSSEAPETITLLQMMTPEYASPEQVNGSTISTLSDIYSLGVILYELLTGHRPYRLLSAAMHEIVRVIAEVEPARPSEVVITTETGWGNRREPVTPAAVSAVREGDPGRLRKRLAGDLDSILLMALRKEPDQRYGSIESFMEDLQRHLEHRPVSAREATWWERAKRFCHRNPAGVVAGILLVISFLGSGVAVVAQARHDVEAALADPRREVFLVPVLLYFATIGLVALLAAIYFFRPGRKRLLGAVAGGVVWGNILIGKWWIAAQLGWWRSRLSGTADPLAVLAPVTWLIFPMLTTLFLLIFDFIGRRFGWKGQAIALVILGICQEPREHAWYGHIIPALTFQPGLLPILCGAALIAAGGGLGLLVMRAIAGPRAEENAPAARLESA